MQKTDTYSMDATLSATLAGTDEHAALAREVYDTLMADIEPELMLGVLPTLDARYAGESADEHASRMARYEAAYTKFDTEFKSFMANVGDEVHTARRQALREREEEAKQSDQPLLASLEAAFS
jgi:hypothetical protein